MDQNNDFFTRGVLSVLSIFLLLLLSMVNLPLESGHTAPHEEIHVNVMESPKPIHEGPKNRFENIIIEDFNNFTNIDETNTTCGIDVRDGRAEISGGYLFQGGGMMLKLVPTGAYLNDNTCTQVCDSTNSGDASGKFVAQWYSGGSFRNNVISGVKFMRGNVELCSAIPRSTNGPGNCIPFGTGGGYGPHQGFVYKNMDSFILQNGDQIWFDVTRPNDADCIYNMFIGHTTHNGGQTLDGNGYTQVCYAANGGRGTAQRGDWMLRFAVSGVAGSEKADLGYVQSVPLYREWPTIGAARMTWYESKPPGTTIVYNMTADGENWVTMQNHTTHIFEDRGSCLLWNATMTSESEDVTPYIDKVIVEYDLISDPEPKGPASGVWQGNRTPTLEWNFTDPDKGDHQSDFLLEIFNDTNMTNTVLNTSWINSTAPEHTLQDELDDGIYYWRVKTKDVYHAASNYSVAKKIMIDVTKPVGNITIEGGAETINEQLVDLQINATDNGSGIADMQIISDTGQKAPWEEFKTEKRIALDISDGLKTIGVRFKDHAGIISDVFNDTIYYDGKGPGDIVVSSPTHPDPTMYYNSTQPVFQWEPPNEVAGIKGYSYIFDSSEATEPARVLYTQNSEITGTFPGEFSGLTDGTWYFHITSCDIYDQWGNTSHFLFNIDTTSPHIYDLEPEEKWFNVTTISASVTFGDVEGYGLDVDSIMYSVKKHGESKYSAWTKENVIIEVVERGIQDNPVRVSGEVDVTVAEGDGNSLRWRIADLAGNGPVVSSELKILVDLTPVSFSNPIPVEGEIFDEEWVPCGITVADEGSGVDGKTIEYSVSHWGDDEKYFLNWTPVNNNMVTDSLNVLMEIEFEPGSDNYIIWRAKDGVGNGFEVSEPIRVWINSAPVPVIHEPSDGAVYDSGEEFNLSAEGTVDNEESELIYYWRILNKTTKMSVFSHSGKEWAAALDIPGKYIVYLHVDDGVGFNESVTADIEITPVKHEPVKVKDPIVPEVLDEEKMSVIQNWWWLFAGIVGILIILIILMIVVARRRKRKKEAEAAPQPVRRMGERSRPDSPGYYPAGPPANRHSTGAPQHWGAAPVYPTLQGPIQERPALPMHTQTSLDAQYPSGQPAMVSPAQSQQQLPQYQQPQPELQYLLPSFPTEDGNQNLNLMALPPGPDPAGAPEQNVLDLTAPLPGPPSLTTPSVSGPVVPGIPDMTITPQQPETSTQDLLPWDSNISSPGQPPSPPPVSSDPIPPTPGAPDTSIDSISGPVREPEPPSPGVSPPVPAPAAPPEPPAAPSQTPVPEALSIQCHECGSMNEIASAERPLIVTCPVCSAQGYIE